MRLFIGLGLDSESAAALSRLRARFEPGSGPDLRWSAPQGWHVTLQFLGSVTEERTTCVVEQLKKIDAAPVPLRIEGLGFFDRAGVFWAGLYPHARASYPAAMRNRRHAELRIHPRRSPVQPAHHARPRERPLRRKGSGSPESSSRQESSPPARRMHRRGVSALRILPQPGRFPLRSPLSLPPDACPSPLMLRLFPAPCFQGSGITRSLPSPST